MGNLGRSETPKSWTSKNEQADYLPRHSPDVRAVFEIEIRPFVSCEIALTQFYKGKMAKMSPKINKIEIWPKSRPKVINSRNKSHGDHIWGMFEL